MCIVVGGDKLDCKFDAVFPTASLLGKKLLINSSVSDANIGTSFVSLDVKAHLLLSLMLNAERMRVP